MTALLLSLGASLAWGVSDFGAGTAGRRRSPVGLLLTMRAAGFAAIALLALVTAPPWIGDRWPLAVGAGATTLVGGVALVRALAIGPMGIAAPIIATGAVVPAVVGLVAGTPPGAVALAGLALACVGTVLASRAPGRDGERVSGAGVAAALAAAVLLGSGMLLIHEAAAESVVAAVTVQRATEAGGLLAVFLLLRARGGPPLAPSAAIVGLGVLECTAITSYATAASLGSLTIAAILSSLYPVVTVLLARTLHGERLSRPQVAGAALTFAGIALVVLGSA